MKIRVDPRRLADGMAAVAATRAAVGDSMALMVDLNQGWRMPGDTAPSLDPVAARDVAAQLAELRRAVGGGAAGRARICEGWRRCARPHRASGSPAAR